MCHALTGLNGSTSDGQTTLCVPLEVKPESCNRLSQLIDRLKQREDKGNNPQVANFERLIQQVPSLHFMSMSVFPATEYDPLFILEANFDGPPGPFWAQLEPVLGDDLRAILRCCKRPLTGNGALYDSVTRPKPARRSHPTWRRELQRPSVFHHGNRGLTRDRMLGDYALFQDVRKELEKSPAPQSKSYHSLAPATLHAALRAALLPGHGWLNEAAPERITNAENLWDWVRAIAFVVGALMVLSSPGLLLASLTPWYLDLPLMIVVAMALSGLTYLNRRGLAGTEIKTRFNVLTFLLGHYIKFLIVAAIYVLGASIVLDIVVLLLRCMLRVFDIGPPLDFGVVWWSTVDVVHVVILGLFSLLFLTVPLLLFLLCRSENLDSSQDAPPIHERTLREMLQAEGFATSG